MTAVPTHLTAVSDVPVKAVIIRRNHRSTSSDSAVIIRRKPRSRSVGIHSRCFQPIHIYGASTGKPVAIILRPCKTPDGAEVTLVLRRVIGRIRARWPAVKIVVRGDSHYGRPEAMAWCERKRIGYIFGVAGNAVLLGRVGDLAEDAALARIEGEAEKVRRYGELRYAAKSWKVERRVVVRVEAGPQGADSRFIVTNLPGPPIVYREKTLCF